ncbi:MAG: alpha-isopropylmalate synthase regulatory domain-containing protein, partial [Betaproteobacteria bacterium]
DVGRTYDSIIRVNSQSGKGGVAYLMEAEFGVVMPRRLQVEFSGEVQAYTDTHGGEMSAQDIWDLFASTYMVPTEPLGFVGYQLTDHPHDANGQGIRLTLEVAGKRHTLSGAGNGPIDAAVQALLTIGVDVQVRSFEERSTKSSAHGGDAQACAFIELSSDATDAPDRFGVGLDHNILTASIKALVSGVNRLGLVPKVAVKAEAALV